MIKCAKDIGFFVIACGMEPNEPGHYIADDSAFLDYSDAVLIADYIRNNPVDYVLPTANDAAYRTGMELAKIFHFPGFDNPDNALNFLEKNHFRNLCSDLNLMIPSHRICDSNSVMQVQECFSVPFLIKPIRGFSGNGIVKIDSEEERLDIARSIRVENSEQMYVVEDFIQGSLHSHSAFVRKGRVVKDFFVDEFCTINEFAVDSSNHPSNVHEDVRLQVKKMIDQILRNSNLADGLIHTQFMISENQAYLIESMRRCPGDLYPKLIELSTGFNYIYNYVAPFIQLPFIDSIFPVANELPIARFTIASKQSTRIFGLKLTSVSKNFNFYPLARNGDYLNSFPGDKAGVMFVELFDKDELFFEVPQFQQKIGIIE
jgi:formate-dependent phosphoribosylglycinamide formyltransferase (GAR transformylase)